MTLFTMAQSYEFRDAKGWIGRTLFHITADDASDTYQADIQTVLADLATAVEGLTNATLQNARGPWQIPQQTLVYGTNSEYPAEWMKLVTTFSTPRGVISRFRIPAPKIAVMEADGVTLINDGTSAPVVAFVNAVKVGINSVFISTASGEAYTHFEGGLVRFGKQPRRFNMRVKSAHLVAGEGE